jgi:hypothetical protein
MNIDKLLFNSEKYVNVHVSLAPDEIRRYRERPPPITGSQTGVSKSIRLLERTYGFPLSSET